MGDRAAPSLRKALAVNTSAEARRRMDQLLAPVDGGVPSAETVREIRAVEALETMGTAEAQRLLDKLAAGPPEMRLTQEARASMGRLTKRASVAP